MEQKIDAVFDWLDSKGKKYMGWFLIWCAGYFIGGIRWLIGE